VPLIQLRWRRGACRGTVAVLAARVVRKRHNPPSARGNVSTVHTAAPVDGVARQPDNWERLKIASGRFPIQGAALLVRINQQHISALLR
jgi:hypothetical protein